MARRGWGEGSICRRVARRNGKEYVYWRAVLPAGSSGRRLEKQGRSERVVRAWLREQISRADRGLPYRGTSVTVGTYAIDWLRFTSGNVAPATTDFYRAALRHLDDVAYLPLPALTTAHVRAVIEKETEAGLSTRTVRAIVQTLALVLRRAEEDGLVDRNVAALVRLPPLDTKPAGHFTAEQARRFLEVAKGDDIWSLYAVALASGLRRGELLALTWADVDRERGRIRVRRSKTAAGVRDVPLPAFALDALAQLERLPGPIWHVRPEYVTRHFQELCQQAGLPRLTFHQLRHTAMTLMAEAGVPIEVRRWIAGHSKTEQTAHYSHESEVLMRDAVERLGGAIAGQSPAANDR